MHGFVEIGSVDEIPPGCMKEYTAQGVPVLIAMVGEKFYATQGRCPHIGGVLAQGKLEGTVVTCPKHSSQFDLKDGSVVRWINGEGLAYFIAKTIKPPRPLNTYLVRIIDGKIRVKISK